MLFARRSGSALLGPCAHSPSLPKPARTIRPSSRQPRRAAAVAGFARALPFSQRSAQRTPCPRAREASPRSSPTRRRQQSSRIRLRARSLAARPRSGRQRGLRQLPRCRTRGCTLAAVTAADLGEGWVRWDCDGPGCSEHLRFWAPLGDPEREGWAMHVAVTPERQGAGLAPRHYCPAHAKRP
jgi:hypothetical protein